MTKPEQRGIRLAIAGLVVGALAWVLCFHDEAPHTYDEEWHAQHGAKVMLWYESGFTDDSFQRNFTLKNYGSLLDVGGILLSRASGLGLYRSRHLLTGLFAWLTLIGIMRLGWQLGGARTALFAGLLLLLFGRFVGHAFNNPKDIPFAALHTWGLSALIAWERHGRSWRLLLFAVLCGLLMSLRLPGLILFAGLGTVLGLRWLRLRTQRPEERLLPQLRRLTLCGLVAYAVAFPFWPYFHLHPILNPLRVLKHQATGAAGSFPVLFDGKSIPNDELPWHYLTTWLLNVLPELWLIGLVLALPLGIHGLWKAHRRIPGWALLLLQLSLPLIMVWVTKPMLYDGIRHFLFVVVLLALPAAAALSWVSTRPSPAVRRGGIAVLCLAATPTLYDLVQLHPYQVTSFNRLVAGGLPRASARFDTDYWGHSFREGSLWLVAHVGERATPATVASSCRGFQVRNHLPEDRFRYLGSVDHELERKPYHDPPEYYLATTRWDRHRLYPGEVIHEVRRQDVLLLAVVKVDRDAARRHAR